MIERLARCLGTVVASSAARDEAGVIDLGTEKTDGVLVASLTGGCSGYMAGGFAWRSDAVMARDAAADDIGVVESGTQKTARSSVTSLAGCGSCNMPARFAGGGHAVMA